jgi:hypothetical protein
LIATREERKKSRGRRGNRKDEIERERKRTGGNREREKD